LIFKEKTTSYPFFMNHRLSITAKLFLTSIAAVSLFSCGHNRLDIDTKNVTIPPVVFKRMDKDLFALNQNNIVAETPALEKKFGPFYNRFISSIINNAGVHDSLYGQSLLRFLNDKDMSIASNDVAKAYSDNDVELIGDELTEAMKRYQALFPKKKAPQQYVTFMSGFNYNIVYVDSTLAVGLEMYLGKDYKYYSALQLPKFRTKTMTKEHIVPDAVRGMILTEFDNSDAVNNLLNHMIFYGKVFYLCDALLPNVHDSLKLGYTKVQLDYCDAYEKNLWGFFVKDQKLYANDLKIIGEYTSDGPFTGSISKECPPRIAMWLGRQIVKSYMEHNHDVSFEDLMNEKDAQKILSQSKYKP
jgi:hypothetical protein